MSSTTTTTRPVAQLGAGIIFAALAGIVGLALALAVAAAMLLNTSPATFVEEGYRDFGLRHPVTQVAPGERYPDYGIRHRALAPADLTRTEAGDNRLDDYGIRCQATGWCSQPASNGDR